MRHCCEVLGAALANMLVHEATAPVAAWGTAFVAEGKGTSRRNRRALLVHFCSMSFSTDGSTICGAGYHNIESVRTECHACLG
jgi:hypothetical protein